MADETPAVVFDLLPLTYWHC